MMSKTNSLYCEEHTEQVASLASLRSKMNLLIGMIGSFGSIIIGILMSINNTTTDLAVTVANLTSSVGMLTKQVEALEKRVAWCEGEIRSLKIVAQARE